jgi:hypothetical protein
MRRILFPKRGLINLEGDGNLSNFKRFSLRIPDGLHYKLIDKEYEFKKVGKKFSFNEFILNAIQEKLNRESKEQSK